MPAAIRIDVSLYSVQSSFEYPSAVRPRIHELAEKLAARVRETLLEFAEAKPDEEHLASAHVYPGLGLPWPPPPDDDDDAHPFGEGATEQVESLLRGEDTNTLGPVEHYPAGAFHVVAKVDLG